MPTNPPHNALRHHVPGAIGGSPMSTPALNRNGPMPWRLDDGGRAAAGYTGQTSDCVTRAIAIATGAPYAEIYALISKAAEAERPNSKRRKGRRSSARTGVFKPTYKRVLESLGWEFTPTMSIGSGCKVHLRADELPPGRLIVSVSRHLAAVVDGVLHDTHDCSRGGTRCVYGYWTCKRVPSPATRFAVALDRE